MSMNLALLATKTESRRRTGIRSNTKLNQTHTTTRCRENIIPTMAARSLNYGDGCRRLARRTRRMAKLSLSRSRPKKPEYVGPSAMDSLDKCFDSLKGSGPPSCQLIGSGYEKHFLAIEHLKHTESCG